MVLGKLPVPGRPTVWTIVGQGSIVLAIGAGWGLFRRFYSQLSFLFSFFLSLDRLKNCIKEPLNPNNQSISLSCDTS